MYVLVKHLGEHVYTFFFAHKFGLKYYDYILNLEFQRHKAVFLRTLYGFLVMNFKMLTYYILMNIDSAIL